MKGFLRSKLVLTLAALLMIAAAVAIPLAGSISHSHAATTRAYAPWTQSEYDQTNNRFNAQETTIASNNLNSLASQWVLNNSIIQQIGKLGIAGNPVVNYDRVYIAAIDGKLYGFDEQTGNLNWHINLTQYQQGAYPNTLQVTNGMVYVSVDGSLGIAAFDASNSSKGLLWQTSHFTSNFDVSGGVLYTSDGYAYDAISGKQLWYQAPPCGGDNRSYLSSISVDSSQGLGYEDCYGVATLYAFHLSDGSIAWTVPLENQGHNTEIVAADGMVYVEGAYFSKLYAFDSQTGNSIWAATPAPSRAPVIANGILYMSYWDNVASASYVAAIDAKKGPNPDGSFMWKVPTNYAYDTTVANGVLYQTGNSGVINAFDAATGNILTTLSYNSIGQLITPITIGDGIIVGFGTSGSQYILYVITLPGTQPPPPPSPQSEQVVVNSANNQYGSIQVSPADTIEVYATGTINVYNSTKQYTPKGNPKCVAPQGYVLPGAPCFELIGQIGNETIQLKDGLTFHPTDSGVIFLDVNYLWGNILQGGWTVTIVVNPSTPKIIKPTNWAGYIAANPQQNVVSYNDIRASWKVNAVSCGLLENSQAAVWVGLGGIDGGLEQIGTLAQCIDGIAFYSAVYEIINGSDHNFNTIQSISPGIVVSAEVQNVSSGNYKLSIGTKSWQYTNYFQGSTDPTAVDSAECVVENPSPAIQTQQLSNFGTQIVYNCTANTMQVNAQLVVYKAVLVNNASVQLAQTSSLDGTGTKFSVKWLRSA